MPNYYKIQFNRIKGAVVSKRKAAYVALLIKAISPVSQLLDKIVCKKIKINLYTNVSIPPCLMIVSPPRAGSTIISQILTRIIPSVYISNLHALLPGLASSIMHKTNSFGHKTYELKNYYGHTSGLFDVNEGNQLIDLLFKEKYNEKLLRHRFWQFITKMRASDLTPLIFKNIKNYKNILALHNAVPELIFLRINRNIEQVIQSELKAYYELGTFNPIPDFLSEIPYDDPVDFCVQQILGIEKIIDEQKVRISPAKWVEWSYGDFCNNTLPLIRNLAKNYLGLELNRLREYMLLEPLRLSHRKKVPDDDINRIRFLLNTYKDNY